MQIPPLKRVPSMPLFFNQPQHSGLRRYRLSDTRRQCCPHGDFKFDMSPVKGPYPDLHRMADIGKQGVKVLLSESTNAERPGFTPSERLVGGHILEAFAQAKQQVFISTFASNVEPCSADHRCRR